MIISAFPGTGKSFLSRLYPDRISDSDSSNFDKSLFPNNYIEHIKMSTAELTLVSSHLDVRNALRDNGLEFTLIYPHEDLRDEYVKRYRDRYSSEEFIDLLHSNFENWIMTMRADPCPNHIVLDAGEYLTDLNLIV
jgi:hypothetical protein